MAFTYARWPVSQEELSDTDHCLVAEKKLGRYCQ